MFLAGTPTITSLVVHVWGLRGGYKITLVNKTEVLFDPGQEGAHFLNATCKACPIALSSKRSSAPRDRIPSLTGTDSIHPPPEVFTTWQLSSFHKYDFHSGLPPRQLHSFLCVGLVLESHGGSWARSICLEVHWPLVSW